MRQPATPLKQSTLDFYFSPTTRHDREASPNLQHFTPSKPDALTIVDPLTLTEGRPTDATVEMAHVFGEAAEQNSCRKRSQRSNGSETHSDLVAKRQKPKDVYDCQSSEPGDDSSKEKNKEWNERLSKRFSAEEETQADLSRTIHLDERLVSGLEHGASCTSLDDWNAREFTRFPFLRPETIRDAQGRRPGDEGYDPSTLTVPQSWLKENKISAGQRQWWTFKASNFDSLLLFKVGKFYELYEMDAHVAVEVLGLKQMKGEQAHCGFPEKSYAAMAKGLAEKGYKVTVIEQTETPEQLKERNTDLKRQNQPTAKVVTREKVAVVTKGTMTESEMISDNTAAAYLMSVCTRIHNAETIVIGFSAVDVASSQCILSQFDDDNLYSHFRTQLSLLEPIEFVLPNDDDRLHRLVQSEAPTARINEMLWSADGFPEPRIAAQSLRSYFTSEEQDHQSRLSSSMEALLDKPEDRAALWASCGALINFLKKGMLDTAVIPTCSFQVDNSADKTIHEHVDEPEYMLLDSSVHESLEIFVDSSGKVTGSLLASLDYCLTPFGKRLLRKWIGRPLVRIPNIVERQNAIQDLLTVAAAASGKARMLLSSVGDLERQLIRLYSSSLKGGHGGRYADHVILYEDVGKKKVVALSTALNGLQTLLKVVDCFKDERHRLSSPLLQRIVTPGKDFPDMQQELNKLISAADWEEAKKTGRIVPLPGVLPSLDSATDCKIEIETKLEEYLYNLRSRFRTQWNNEVAYLQTKNDRYVIEVADQAASAIPAEFELVSQRKGYKRYTSPTLKELINQLEAAENARDQFLTSVVHDMLKQFVWHEDLWTAAVQAIAQLDVLMSFTTASVSMQSPTCRPQLSPYSEQSLPVFSAKSLSHPNLQVTGSFVPNDISLGENGSNFIILTGANMGGKSTLLRQVCLATLMAQIGAHVPATSLTLTPVDSIFVRMGAKDRIVCGQSTFFVELAETATMLKNATRRSLVALDELGRGTATMDGQAIAHAVLEYLSSHVKCRGIFSTHYHALARAAECSPGIVVQHMSCAVDVSEQGEDRVKDVRFLYKLADGVAPKSYGMNVARLAGLPNDTIQLAHEISEQMERKL